MKKTKNLSGRVVVITGAGSGIGRELALQCAGRGAHLTLRDINESALASTAEVTRTVGAEVLISQVDVSGADAMTRFAEAHVMYVLSRTAPPLARWVATRLAELAM